MRPQIDGFSIPIGLCTKEYVVKPTSSSACHIDIDHAVRHFEILQSSNIIFQGEAAPAQIVADFRLGPELPSWRIDRKCLCLRGPKTDEACDANGQGQQQ